MKNNKKIVKKLPLEKVGGLKLINFSKILEEEMKDPEFRKGFEMEKKKLEISLAIIELRKKKKISQAKLAQKAGVKQSAIGRIEAGKQNLTIETLQQIALALNKKLEICFR